MMKRFSQLSELSLSEFKILLIALILLPFTALSLNFKGYKWTQHFLERRLPKSVHKTASKTLQLEKSHCIARVVLIAANHGPYKANCLKKSLVTWWLLARRGIHTELKIGVNKDKGDFNAHAWVEFEGVVLNDTADVDERFTTFDSKKTLKP